tara:strand:- start:78 stop:410 length:333 start_codon:yes stop_codon:yes gene_type:complete
MKSYPIWNQVTACIYKSGKSWGARKDALVSVFVGTSRRNSHAFVEHSTTHREHPNGVREYRFHVNGACIKRALLFPKSDSLLFIRPLDEIEVYTTAGQTTIQKTVDCAHQ